MKGFNLTEYDNLIVAQLYETTVAVIDTKTKNCNFGHGGWVTMSTRKAINKALQKAGLNPCAHIKKDVLYVNERAINATF